MNRGGKREFLERLTDQEGERLCARGLMTDDGNVTEDESAVSIAKWSWKDETSSGDDARLQQDVGGGGCHPRRFPWRRVLFPPELSLGLYLFTVYFSLQLFQQYAFQRTATTAIVTAAAMDGNITSTTTRLNASIGQQQCWSQDSMENLTNQAWTFADVQAATDRLNIISLVAFFLPSSLMVVVWGPLSDAFGRKPFMLLTVLGQALSSALSLLIIYLELDVRVFAVSEFVGGSLGGLGAMIALSFAYVSDLTPKRWLTARIGLLDVAGLLAAAASSSTSYRWIQRTDCNFLPPWILTMAVSILALLATLFLPESLSRQKKMEQWESSDGKRPVLGHLVSGLKIFFYPRHLGWSKFWRLWVLVAILCIAFINQVGMAQIVPYFLHNKPFSWSYSLIGTFEATVLVSQGLCLFVILPVMVMAKLSDVYIGLVGILFSIGCGVLMALLKTTWEIFLVGIISGVGALIAPIIRSKIAKLIPAAEQGSAFSVIGFFQLLASCISTVTYNYVYHPGTNNASGDQQGSSLSWMPTYSFWLMAVLWVATVPLLMMFLPCCSCSRSGQNVHLAVTAAASTGAITSTGEQKEHLLAFMESSSGIESSSSSSICSSLDNF